MARPTTSERSPLAEAIRQLRMSLGETQQMFAARLGQSVVSIAKYETARARPRDAILQRLADIAESAGLKQQAREIKKEYIPALRWTAEERRIVDLQFEFDALLNDPGSARLRAIETILMASVDQETGRALATEPTTDLRELRIILSAIFPDEPRLSILCGLVWLLIVPGGTDVRHLRQALVNRIKLVLLERDEALIEDELELLGELGVKASEAVQEALQLGRRLEGLTLPLALRRIREDVGLGIEKFANQIGVTPSEVRNFESGKTSPDYEALAKIMELPVNEHTRVAEGSFLFEIYKRRSFANGENLDGAIRTLKDTSFKLDRKTVVVDLLRHENERLAKRVAELELFRSPVKKKM